MAGSGPGKGPLAGWRAVAIAGGAGLVAAVVGWSLLVPPPAPDEPDAGPPRAPEPDAAAPGPPPPAAPDATPEPPPPVLPPRPDRARFVLDPRRHVLDPTRSAALHRKLRPGHRYLLYTSGSGSTGGLPGWLRFRSTLWYGKGPQGAQAGVAEREAVPLRGLSDIWFFILDDNTSDNRGSIELHLDDETDRARAVFPLDARAQALTVHPAVALPVAAAAAGVICNGDARCEIDLTGSFEAGKGAPAGLLGYVFEGSIPWSQYIDGTWGFVRPGDTLRPRHKWDTLWLFVLDDDAADNRGTVEARVRGVPR
jgi:hypothetical protein